MSILFASLRSFSLNQFVNGIHGGQPASSSSSGPHRSRHHRFSSSSSSSSSYSSGSIIRASLLFLLLLLLTDSSLLHYHRSSSSSSPSSSSLTVSASGYFEIQFLRVLNKNGRLANNSCCDDGTAEDTDPTIPCPQTDQCDTYVFVCLMESRLGGGGGGGSGGSGGASFRENRYRDSSSSSSTAPTRCSFGNESTPVLGPNSFTFDKDEEVARVRLPFQFAWTVSQTNRQRDSQKIRNWI